MDTRLCLENAYKNCERNETQENTHWIRDIMQDIDHALTHIRIAEKLLNKRIDQITGMEK